jgi:hypothetical protein
VMGVESVQMVDRFRQDVVDRYPEMVVILVSTRLGPVCFLAELGCLPATLFARMIDQAEDNSIETDPGHDSIIGAVWSQSVRSRRALMWPRRDTGASTRSMVG